MDLKKKKIETSENLIENYTTLFRVSCGSCFHPTLIKFPDKLPFLTCSAKKSGGAPVYRAAAAL